LKERLQHIPTPDELRSYIPGLRDFLVYLTQLVLLVLATVAYSVIDIVLYNHVFVATDSSGEPLIKNGVTLYGNVKPCPFVCWFVGTNLESCSKATTVNLIGVCFDFLWVFMICVKVYPNALRKWWSRMIWAIIGCCIHIVIHHCLV